MKILNYILAALLLILAPILIVWLCIAGQYLAAGLILFIFIMTCLIFFKKNAYPLRFMYPGLLTFLIFTVIPMFFTIWIAFTNLSTGHLLSKEAVYNLFKNDTYLQENTSLHTFELFYITPKTAEENPYYKILIPNPEDSNTKFTASFALPYEQTLKKIELQEIRILPSDLSEISPLSRGAIFQLEPELKEIVFSRPDGESLKYNTSSTLGNYTLKYEQLEKFGLKDARTGLVYYPNDLTGFFSTESGEHLVPGYYVTVGIKNFGRLFFEPGLKESFLRVFIWTITWGGLTVLLPFILGMLLSLSTNDKRIGPKIKTFYRIIYIIPYSIPAFISILIFQGMLNRDFGTINQVLSIFGILNIDWLGDSLMAKVSCVLVNLWLGFPYMFLISTGIIQSIPPSVYEAASLDGAGKWDTLFKITLPMVMSAIGPLLVGSFAFNFNNFVGIYLLTGGGPPSAAVASSSVLPAGETDILLSYTFRLAFEGGQGQDFGLASTIAIFIFCIVAILTLINFKISGMTKDNTR